MTAKNYLANVNPGSRPMFRNSLSALVIATVLFLSALTTPLAQGQTFQVLHSFTGKSGGTESYAGVTLDPAGQSVRDYDLRRFLQRRAMFRRRLRDRVPAQPSGPGDCYLCL